MERQCLMIPGPTPVPVRAALAGAGPMINHRGPEFGTLLQEVTEGLQRILMTTHTVLVFPAAGTGGMEAVAFNLVAPGERVLVTVAGEFGARFAEIMRVACAHVRTLNFEWGTPVDPVAVGRALEEDPSIGVVVVTHNETSTGVTMDLAGIRRAIPRDDVLLVADAISSIGAIELYPADWGVDVVVGASQKGLMTPPGLALLTLSPRAWEKVDRVKPRSVYWDFSAARRFLERPTPQTPYTPAVSLLYTLRESLRMLEAEGPKNVFRRHAAVARAVRAGIRALGMQTLAGEAYASNTVTAVVLPEDLECQRLLALLRQKYGVVLAGGQGRLSGRIFRIGHVGQVNWRDVVVTLAALEMACLDLGLTVERGRAVAAAEEVLSTER